MIKQYFDIVAALVFRNKVDFGASSKEPQASDGVPTSDTMSADVVTSKVRFNDNHKVLLDIDLPAMLLPSSTPGHYHLLIDKEVTWEAMQEVLTAMAKAGIVEEGYAATAIRRGFTSLRPPWIRKGDLAPAQIVMGQQPDTVPF